MPPCINKKYDLLFTVCGRTYQETKAIFGSPQQPLYSATPGLDPRPYQMVHISLLKTIMEFHSEVDVSCFKVES